MDFFKSTIAAKTATTFVWTTLEIKGVKIWKTNIILNERMVGWGQRQRMIITMTMNLVYQLRGYVLKKEEFRNKS